MSAKRRKTAAAEVRCGAAAVPAAQGGSIGEAEEPPSDRLRVALPRAVSVRGCPGAASWLNQTYWLVASGICISQTSSEGRFEDDSEVEVAASTAAANLGRIGLPRNRGSVVYVGLEPCREKHDDACPCIWYDTRHEQWKLFTNKFPSSHYLTPGEERLGVPTGAGVWQPGPTPKVLDAAFPEELRTEHVALTIEVSEFESAGRVPVALGRRGKIPFIATLDPDVKLTSAEAGVFMRDGFLVKVASEIGTGDLAGRCLRAVNVALRSVSLVNPADWACSNGDPDWPVFAALLTESRLWSYVGSMMGTEPMAPCSAQRAVCFPDILESGTSYREAIDDRAGDDYHIDGRGEIPNNFALLVGVALNNQLAQGPCQSWGGFTVFPGSHKNRALHAAYPQQKTGETQGRRLHHGSDERMNLGQPVQLKMQQGDVIFAHSLLAHRRAKNYSEGIRSMVFFRLKPKAWTGDIKERVMNDPFAHFPGVVMR